MTTILFPLLYCHNTQSNVLFFMQDKNLSEGFINYRRLGGVNITCGKSSNLPVSYLHENPDKDNLSSDLTDRRTLINKILQTISHRNSDNFSDVNDFVNETDQSTTDILKYSLLYSFKVCLLSYLTIILSFLYFNYLLLLIVICSN